MKFCCATNIPNFFNSIIVVTTLVTFTVSGITFPPELWAVTSFFWMLLFHIHVTLNRPFFKILLALFAHFLSQKYFVVLSLNSESAFSFKVYHFVISIYVFILCVKKTYHVLHSLNLHLFLSIILNCNSF